MKRLFIGLILLPVALVLQAIWTVPITILVIVTDCSLITRELIDAKREHRRPHPFRRFYNFIISSEDWIVHVFLIFFPMAFWTAFTFPKLRLFD